MTDRGYLLRARGGAPDRPRPRKCRAPDLPVFQATCENIGSSTWSKYTAHISAFAPSKAEKALHITAVSEECRRVMAIRSPKTPQYLLIRPPKRSNPGES